MSDQKTYHTPVLLKACIEKLNIQQDGVYVDLTFGGGGHSKAILEKMGNKGRLFAFDQDEDAQRNVPNDRRFVLIPQNFRFLKDYLRLNGISKVNGILGDLGVSSHQFDEAVRGFSFRADSELDMRMNRKQKLTASGVINEYTQERLQKIFREYGELEKSGLLARKICDSRSEKMITTSGQLRDVLQPMIPKKDENKFLAKLFQSLRIEVNDEMNALKECLTQCAEVLDRGGRLVMISYHSLEDRLVKDLIRSGNVDGREEKDPVFGTVKKVFQNLTSKPIIPESEEVKFNTRARSAKLRVGEKL